MAGQLLRVPRIVPYFVLSVPPRARSPLAAALLVTALLGGTYILWLRDSSLVAVERVEVTGLTSRDAPRVRAALESTARDMTTLHLERDRLLEAVAPWPVVNELRVVADFPHGVRIEAVERRPVALAGPERVPVAADGTVLQGLRGTPRLPTVESRRARVLVQAAGAAPPALLARVTTVRRGERGLVAELKQGPDVVLGSPARLRAKWAAAAAVLADESSRGADYVDVRLPERPVAGGLPEPEPEPQSIPSTSTPELP